MREARNGLRTRWGDSAGPVGDQVPVDLGTVRVVLEMDGIEPEEAARITINGKDAGGFIGKPLRHEVTSHLTNGVNHIRIEPFAPRSVRLAVVNTKATE